MDKTIKFERIFFSLETFLECLQEIHVNFYYRYDPSLVSYGTSRDTMRTFAMTLSSSQATTIPCPQR